jgi:hypothetical protein
MNKLAAIDFPVARQTLEELDAWIMALVSPLLPAEPITVTFVALAAFNGNSGKRANRAWMDKSG